MFRVTGPWLLNWALSQSLVSSDFKRVKFRAWGLRQNFSSSICRVSRDHLMSYPDLTLFYTRYLSTRLTPTDAPRQLTFLAQDVPLILQAWWREFSFNVRYIDWVTFLCEILKYLGFFIRWRWWLRCLIRPKCLTSRVKLTCIKSETGVITYCRFLH